MQLEEVKNQIEKVFKDNDWDYAPISDNENMIITGFGMSADNFNNVKIIFDVDMKRGGIKCLGFLPDKVKYAQRDRVASYFAKVNYSLLKGNFQMDYEDGEVRFRHFISLNKYIQSDVEKYVSSEISDAIDLELAMFKRYGDSIYEVNNGKNPQDF